MVQRSLNCKLILLSSCFFSASLPACSAQDAVNDLPARSYSILRKYCHRCHGQTLKVPGFFVLDYDILTHDRGDDRDRFVEQSSPAKSLVWGYIQDGYMPPEAAQQLEADELATLKQWIQKGAPRWNDSRANRPFISHHDELKAIRDHLLNIPLIDRLHIRFFSIAHLHNNTNVKDEQLRVYRAALSKAMNSLSRKPDIVLPNAVAGTHEAIFSFDLRDFGWEKNGKWEAVLATYPYGLKPSVADELTTYKQIADLYGFRFDGIVAVRGDWFTATATRPPLYHALLEIPETQDLLDGQMGVDPTDDFRRNRLQRAGVLRSGVSGQNRIADRHASGEHSYWITYDFRKNSGRGNVARFPLGPAFDEHPFDDRRFEHAGSEIIFALPNGLQGYMLVERRDGENRRIDTAPVDVVWDPNATSGSPQIVNGLSCIGCHKHGMVLFTESVRNGVALFNGDETQKVQELFVEDAVLQRILALDQVQFLKALQTATGPFLQTGADSTMRIEEFLEPISEVARLHDKDLGLAEAAAELGFEDSAALKVRLENRRLRELGLGPWIKGNTVKRSMWDSREAGISPYQQACLALGIGTAVIR